MKLISFIVSLFILNSSHGAINPKLIRESVEKFHPIILSSYEEVLGSQEKIKAAKGNFDSKIIGDHFRVSTGMWARTYTDLMIEKPLLFNNTKIYTGYSYGFNGNFPPQFSTWSTNSGGTPRAGLSTSLWRNRSVDTNRGLIKTSQLDNKIADGKFNLTIWDIQRLGEVAYWEWVTSLKIQKIYQALLQNAEERNKYLVSRVVKGALPKIILRENEQYIANRKASLFKAKERQISASFTLSLFYRDSFGETILPKHDEGFEDYPDDLNYLLNSITTQMDVKQITTNRPEVTNLQAELQKADIQLKISEELIKPKLDLWGDYTRNIGNEDPVNPPHIWSFGIKFEIPIERNLGNGNISIAKNSMRATQKNLQFQKEKFEAEINSAKNALYLQKEQVEQSRIELARSKEILEAENFKFKSGSGNLFLINLREESVANAEASLYETSLNFISTYITYQAMTKTNLKPYEVIK